jgi:phosphoenolpyruvate carboxykinase (ATP)
MASLQIPPRSAWRAILESAFYANSVNKTSIPELYDLSLKQPGVIVTSHPLYNPEQFGLSKDSKVLVSNDGGIVGRTARARRLVRQMGDEKAEFIKILSEAVFQLNKRDALWLEAIVGLHPDFMVKANLLSPVTDAKNMFDWGTNFAPWIEPWIGLYEKSRQLDDEPEIMVIADPEWHDERFPDGLVIIDEDENCAALLGLRYFGERKKGTLTLAWTMGTRQNMVACHGGIKTVDDNPPVAVFGLSGSGKSSLTNSFDHAGTLTKNEKVTVVHDDAFLIDLDADITVVLEPSLFDKTDQVRFEDPVIDYFYSAQNVGVTQAKDGQRLIVAEDIRNANGRCIKSRDMFTHANSCARPGSVIWLQKDPSLPPLSKVDEIGLAVAMGASLSTMRARGVENVPAEELEKLVIEPFANPFRVHPLMVDCQQFSKLFKLGTECYVMNTHAFGMPGEEVDIPLRLSLSIVTAIVRGSLKWKEWSMFPGLLIPANGAELFDPTYDSKYSPTEDIKYLKFLRRRMQDRITYLSNKRDIENDMESIFIDPLVAARLHIDSIINPI